MSMHSMWESLILTVMMLMGVPMPLGVPPLPENPALLRVAPDSTVAFYEWFGTADARADSRNVTERMAAEPQLQALVGHLRTAFGKVVEHEHRDLDESRLAGESFDLLMKAMARPGSVFVFDFDPNAAGGDVAKLGVCVDFGDGVRSAAAQMRSWTQYVGEAEGLAARSYRDVQLQPFSQRPQTWWATHEDYVVLGVGQGAIERVVDGLLNVPGHESLHSNPRFDAARGRATVARPTSRSFVDVERLIQQSGTGMGMEFSMALNLMGLAHLEGFVSESGLEGAGFVQRSSLGAGEDVALFGLLGGAPLVAEDFALVPGDATLAFGARVAPGEVLERFWKLLDGAMPGASDRARRGMYAEVSDAVGVDVEKELVQNLGDRVLLWSAPEHGGALDYNGLTLAVSLENEAAFAAAFDKVMAKIEEATARGRQDRRPRRDFYLEKLPVGDEHLWFFNPIGLESIISPSFCVADGHLMVSVFPQPLISEIERGRVPRQNALAQDAEFTGSFTPKTLAAGFVDLEQLLPVLYPLAQIGAQFAVSEMQREGFPLDIRMFPSLGSIAPHIGREVSRIEMDARGVACVRQGTLPWADPTVAALVPTAMVAWMFLAYSEFEVREVAVAMPARAGYALPASSRHGKVAGSTMLPVGCAAVSD